MHLLVIKGAKCECSTFEHLTVMVLSPEMLAKPCIFYVAFKECRMPQHRAARTAIAYRQTELLVEPATRVLH